MNVKFGEDGSAYFTTESYTAFQEEEDNSMAAEINKERAAMLLLHKEETLDDE